MDLKKLEKLFGKWDDGYYDPTPQAFRRFSKGLYNLMSFTVQTIKAYDLVKTHHPEQQVEILNGIVIEDAGLKGIIEEYFKPRLFELGYLGAWAAFETYLRDVAWLKLCDISKPLANEIIGRTKRITDMIGLYKRLLNVELQEISEAKALFDDRKKRNKLAHSGSALGYTSCLEMEEYLQDHVEYAATEEETVITEELFCNTLANMWKVGDFLRKKFFETRSPKKYE